MVDATGMTADEVHRVVDALADAGCVSWLEGGWGVDALVGRQTRRHRDLDLAFDANDEDAAFEVFAAGPPFPWLLAERDVVSDAGSDPGRLTLRRERAVPLLAARDPASLSFMDALERSGDREVSPGDAEGQS